MTFYTQLSDEDYKHKLRLLITNIMIVVEPDDLKRLRARADKARLRQIKVRDNRGK